MNFVLVVVISVVYGIGWYLDYKTFDRLEKKISELENEINTLKGDMNEV